MELSLLSLVSIIFLITALGSVINNRFLHYPSTIGVMLISTILSLCFFFLQAQDIIHIQGIDQLVKRVNFEDLLLHWMLPILLFAGSLHVSASDLKKYKFQIFTFATFGVVISAAVCATIIHYAAPFFNYNITFLQAMVFGVLISSTDPICALGILKGGDVSPALRAKITGESLFNDGTSVVLFLTVSHAAFYSTGDTKIDISVIALNLFSEVVFGALLGLTTAFFASLLTKSVDAYDVEIMITLALAFGTYALAETFHVSAPIAVVVAGLYIGNRTIVKFMSEKSREHVITFWTLIDEILNANLFVLMGLVLVMFNLSWIIVLFSSISVLAMLIARYFSIIGSMLILLPLKPDFKKTPILMTWGGLRGGISIALALSIPNSHPEIKELFLTMTFICVFFSVLVQGMTLPKVLKLLNAPKIKEDGE